MKKILVLAAVFCALQQAGAQTTPYGPAADTRPPAPQDIVKNRTDWGVDLSLGGSSVQGTENVETLNTSFDIFKVVAPSSSTVYLSGNLIHNTFNGVAAVNQGSLTTLYNNSFSLPYPWKFFVYDTSAYNNLFLLNYRTTNGVGMCFDDLKIGPATQVVSLAVSQEYEDFSDGSNDATARAVFHDELLDFKISKTAKIHGDFFYMPSLAALGNYRLSGEISLETMIWARYLGLKISWIDEYDSYLHQYAPTVKLNDSVWTTALTYHFGQ